MPMFEYACVSCGKEFEKLVFSSETGPVTCPYCGSETTEKKLSVFASASSGKSPAGSVGAGHRHVPGGG